MSVFYVVAPRWRALFRPGPGHAQRPLLRWQVVHHTTAGVEHVSYHWAEGKAWDAAERLAGTR
jgi:hypothetical protein